MSNLYDRIKALCDERGVKIAQMCREANVYQGTLTDLKKGRSNSISAKNLQKIAAYFGVTINYLLGEEKTTTPDEAELWSLRQAMVARPELKVLFDMTKDASPARVRKMLKMMELLEDEDD